MMEKVENIGIEENMASKALCNFQSMFKGKENANLIKASTWYRSREGTFVLQKYEGTRIYDRVIHKRFLKLHLFKSKEALPNSGSQIS